MALGNIGDYSGGKGLTSIQGANGEIFLLIYNDTGGTLTNGDIKMLDFTDDADSVGTYPTPAVPATNTELVNYVVVVNNSPLGKTTILDTEYGYVQFKGYCSKVKSTGADEDYLEILNAGTSAQSSGGLAGESFGIQKSAASGGFAAAYLFGRPAAIKAT